MKVLQECARVAGLGQECALATVVGTEGSTPGRPAMRMLSGPEGRLRGTIGGGHVEQTVLEASREALRTGAPKLLSFTLDDDQADEGGLLCGGTVRILVERVDGRAEWAQEAADLMQSGGRGVVLAHIGDSVRRETLRGDAAETWLAREEPRLEGDCFIEPIVQPRCIVLGAGHVGAVTAELAATMGFAVVVVEDRPDQAARVDSVSIVCAPLEEGFASLEPGAGDYVVVVTRGHGLDLLCVRAALGAGVRYVGMLGAKRKARIVRAALEREGIDAGRLHSPVGLAVGAQTAPEIALSIVAQMVQLRRTGAAGRETETLES